MISAAFNPNAFSGPVNFKEARKQYGMKFGDPHHAAAMQRVVAMQFLPLMMQRLQTQSGIESAFGQMANRLMPGTNQSRRDEFANRANTTATESGNQAALALQAAGFGSGVSGGAIMDAFNNAGTERNMFERYLNSPEYAMQMNELASAGNPYTAPFAGLMGASQPPKAPKQGNPLMGLVGTALGTAASGGAFNNLFSQMFR